MFLVKNIYYWRLSKQTDNHLKFYFSQENWHIVVKLINFSQVNRYIAQLNLIIKNRLSSEIPFSLQLRQFTWFSSGSYMKSPYFYMKL